MKNCNADTMTAISSAVNKYERCGGLLSLDFCTVYSSDDRLSLQIECQLSALEFVVNNATEITYKPSVLVLEAEMIIISCK